MKATVDKQDEGGWTPLHIAGEHKMFPDFGYISHCHPVSAGHEQVVIDLLGAGADIKKTNDKGLTAL